MEIEETPILIPKVQTEAEIGIEAGKIAADPAIWVHPTLPEYSLILGTLSTNGIAVYGMTGDRRQIIDSDGRDLTGVDVLYAFRFDDTQLIDIAVVSDRANNALRIYRIQHDLVDGNYLTDITDGNLPSLSFPVGVATYISPYTGKHYAFVICKENANMRDTGHVIDQIELNRTDDKQRIQGNLVRTIDLSGKEAGGLVVDQELGFLYVSLQSNHNNAQGIVKYDAEPDEYDEDDEYPQTIVAGDEEYFSAREIEGLTLYYGDRGDGYLVVSVAGDSTFAVFEREEDNEFYDSFTIGRNDDNDIDRVDKTQGIDIINVNLGPEFKCGLFVVQDSDNAQASVIEAGIGGLANVNANFKLGT